MAEQTAPFGVIFDAKPTRRPLDGVIGLAAGPASDYTDLAAIVRFNPSGNIDARNGGIYAAAAAIPYAANTTYHFRMIVYPATRTYSVYVTPPGGAERLVGSHFAFRSEQAGVAALRDWSVIVDPTPAGAAVTVTGFAVIPALDASNSVVVRASNGFSNYSIAAQTGTFTASFDAMPSTKPLDGVIAMAQGVPGSYTDLAAIIRFAPTGYIDARNGGAYTAASSIPYVANTVYRFRTVVNVATHTYSVYVTPPGGSELTVGEHFAFRSEQANVTKLDTCTVKLDPAPSGASITIGNLTITP